MNLNSPETRELVCLVCAALIIVGIIWLTNQAVQRKHSAAVNPGKFIQQLTRQKYGHYAKGDDGYDNQMFTDAEIDWPLYDYLIHGLPIAPITAEKLERLFPKYPAQLWLNLQKNWDLYKGGGKQ